MRKSKSERAMTAANGNISANGPIKYHNISKIQSLFYEMYQGSTKMDFLGPIPMLIFISLSRITDTPIQIFLSRYLEPILPWKSRVLARAQFEFAKRVTLGTSNILVYILGLPWPRTLINHIDVSIQAGQKRCCFTDRIRQESYLLVSSTGLDTSPLVFF